MSSLNWRALLFLVPLLALFQASCGGSSGYSNSNNPPNVQPAVVTVTPNPVNAVAGGAGVTLNISVANDLPSDVLSASVTSSPACGGNPCGSFGAITGTPGSGTYTVQYTPPANASSATSPTITVSSSLTGSTPGTTTVNLASNATVVTVAPNPANAVAGGAPVTLNISVANDQPSDVLSASVTSSPACGGNPCGSFGAFAGTPGSGSYTVQYTPPASIQQGSSQTITVSSNLAGSTPGTTTLNLTSTSSAILCPAHGNEALMTGTWVFLLRGFNGTNPMAMGAVFTVDGSIGLITSGTMDINIAGSAPGTNLVVNPSASTYSVDSQGRACIGLVTSAGTKVFHAALASYDVTHHATEGQIQEFDDTLGTGGRALGLLKQQATGQTWAASSLNSPFVFGLRGLDAAGGRLSAAGGITFDGVGNLTNGLEDINDAGTFDGGISPAMPQTIPTGTYTLGADGRGTVSLVVGNSTVNGVIYAVDSGELFLLSTSQVNPAPLLSGRVLQIVAPQALVDATGVAGYQLVTLEGSNDATIGILSFSLGRTVWAAVSGTLWHDAAGTASSQPIPSGSTFMIADKSHGRVTFSVPGWTNSPVAYFTGFSKLAGLGNTSLPTTAFLVGTGSDAEAGEIIWQSFPAPSFSAASLKYSAAYSDLQSSGNNAASQTTSTGQITMDGIGSFMGFVDVSAAALSTNVGLTGTYTVNMDGSGSFTAAGAANAPWPMVTNGVRSYHIIEPAGNTAPVVNVISKQ